MNGEKFYDGKSVKINTKHCDNWRGETRLTDPEKIYVLNKLTKLEDVNDFYKKYESRFQHMVKIYKNKNTKEIGITFFSSFIDTYNKVIKLNANISNEEIKKINLKKEILNYQIDRLKKGVKYGLRKKETKKKNNKGNTKKSKSYYGTYSYKKNRNKIYTKKSNS